jgi:hypothetical protein
MRQVLVTDFFPNRRNRRAGVPHLHRVDCDVDADRARYAVRLPLADAAVRISLFHETIRVMFVASAAATAVARDITRHFRMVCREHVCIAQNFHRPRRCITRDVDEGHIKAGSVWSAGLWFWWNHNRGLRIIGLGCGGRSLGGSVCRRRRLSAGRRSRPGLIIRTRGQCEYAAQRRDREMKLQHGRFNCNALIDFCSIEQISFVEVDGVSPAKQRCAPYETKRNKINLNASRV